MAIQIRLTPPTLPHGDENVISTRVQISDDSGFLNILADETTIVLAEIYNITINYEAVVGKTYYARSMYITDKAGAEGWGPTIEFVASNVIEQAIDMRIPETSYPPSISMPIFGSYDTPITGLIFDLDFLDSIAGDVRSIDFIIEDKESNLIVSQIGMTRGFKRILLEQWLTPNTIYIARVAAILDTGSQSMFAGIVFNTARTIDVFMITSVNLEVSGSLVNTSYDDTMVLFTMELMDIDGIIHTATGTDRATVFAFDNALREQFKVGRVKTKYTNNSESGWRYFYNRNLPISLPLSLPAILGD